jgi:hypothetical protein
MKVQKISELIKDTLLDQDFFKDFRYGWRSDVNLNDDSTVFPRIFYPASPDGIIDYKTKSFNTNIRLIFEDLQGIDNNGAEVEKTQQEYWDELLDNGVAFIQNLNTRLKQNGLTIVDTSSIRYDTNSNVANTRLIIAFFDFTVFGKLDCI